MENPDLAAQPPLVRRRHGGSHGPRHGGWFTPRYRPRRVAPEYLLLARSLQREDHGAGLAGELARRLDEAGVAVRHFRFRDDPRRLIPWDGHSLRGASLAQLAEQHGAAHLILLSDLDILFHPLTGEPRPWLQTLERWPRRTWLHSGAADAAVIQWLGRRGFAPLPFNRDSLADIGAWLQNPAEAVSKRDKADSPRLESAPTLLDYANDWLSPYPPPAANLAALALDLRRSLGEDGFLLLQALAAYPEPHWNLSQALDFLLFQQTQPGQREERLLRLARLPWLRHGFIPDYLHEHWLRRLQPPQREQVQDAYAQLFNGLTDTASGPRLELPIAAPAKPDWLKDLFRRRDGGSFDDPVFKAIVLGKTLKFWDFELPRWVERFVPGGRWVVDASPALFGLALAFLATQGGDWVWQRLKPQPTPATALIRVPIMVKIPGGEFMMGSGADDTEAQDDEKPPHKVAVKAFSLGQYEVTKAQFATFVDDSGYRAKGCWTWDAAVKKWAEQAGKDWREAGFPQTDNHPVACVSFEDAQAYIRWLNAKTGRHYRLPTEAEWEYAAKAGTATRRYWGDSPQDACRHANVADQSAQKLFPDWTVHPCNDGYVYTAPVGRFQPNAFGLHDMLGNVWEWTCSAYTGKYDGSENICKENASVGRAVRGGSWDNRPYGVRSADRGRDNPTNRYSNLGFRLAQD